MLFLQPRNLVLLPEENLPEEDGDLQVPEPAGGPRPRGDQDQSGPEDESRGQAEAKAVPLGPKTRFPAGSAGRGPAAPGAGAAAGPGGADKQLQARPQAAGLRGEQLQREAASSGRPLHYVID